MVLPVVRMIRAGGGSSARRLRVSSTSPLRGPSSSSATSSASISASRNLIALPGAIVAGSIPLIVVQPHPRAADATVRRALPTRRPHALRAAGGHPGLLSAVQRRPETFPDPICQEAPLGKGGGAADLACAPRRRSTHMAERMDDPHLRLVVGVLVASDGGGNLARGDRQNHLHDPRALQAPARDAGHGRAQGSLSGK